MISFYGFLGEANKAARKTVEHVAEVGAELLSRTQSMRKKM